MNFVSSAICIFLIAGSVVAAEVCVDCTSSRDIGCAQNASYAATKECPPTSTSLGCFVRIVEGHTIRGCMADLDETTQLNCSDSSFTECQRCFGVTGRPTCNDYTFPHNRLQCFQCEGGLDSQCGTEMTFNSQACPLHQNGDRCFIWRSAARIQRGCLTSSGSLCTDLQNCFVCDGHGCNMYDQTNTNIPLAPGSAAIQTATLVMPLVMLALAKLALI